MTFKPFPKPEKTPKKDKKPLKKSSQKSDYLMWEAFSLMIRLRDVTNNEHGPCITCGKLVHWYYEGDCGHGIGRQHWGTRYNKINNNLQCKKCNGFEEGRKDLYEKAINKKHGPGMWEKLQASKNGKKPSAFEIEEGTKLYLKESIRIAKEKGISIPEIKLKRFKKYL